MNCKPDELAIVAKVTAENVRPYLGRIVRTIQIVDSDCWTTQPELEPGRAIYDGALRPIRDPGDDAQDETLLWLPTPSRERETA